MLPNLQRLGPRCGRDMQGIVASLRARDGDEALQALREHGVLTVHIGDARDLFDPPRTYALAENDLVVRREPREGLVLSTRGAAGQGLGLVVAVDTRLDGPLRREGLAREIVRAVQAQRRAAGVGVTDRIELRLGGSADLLTAAREHERYLAQETLATSVLYVAAVAEGAVEVEGQPLSVAVAVQVPAQV